MAGDELESFRESWKTELATCSTSEQKDTKAGTCRSDQPIMVDTCLTQIKPDISDLYIPDLDANKYLLSLDCYPNIKSQSDKQLVKNKNLECCEFDANSKRKTNLETLKCSKKLRKSNLKKLEDIFVDRKSAETVTEHLLDQLISDIVSRSSAICMDITFTFMTLIVIWNNKKKYIVYYMFFLIILIEINQ